MTESGETDGEWIAARISWGGKNVHLVRGSDGGSKNKESNSCNNKKS